MSNKPRIYTIATAHLDTIWNWDFEHVIDVCLKDTLYDNFKLFEKYPSYRFNFEGSYRYELFKEYYPQEFEKLKEYVAEGKWNITGSAFENGDVNVPSPESLFRNILYGNRYFAKTFGKKSNDIFLPDCFGFGYALPSIIHHANLKGFSTQKLTWGSAYGVPFDIGYWQGVDGSRIIASLDPKSYCTSFKKVRIKPDLTKKLNSNLKNYNLNCTFAYHGVGDVGGAPKEESVKTVDDEISINNSSDIDILSSTPSEFFDDIDNLPNEIKAKLPVWNNELVMTNHGVGSYTSRAFSKRMNRRDEELADQAERASVIASAISSYNYPSDTLERAWKRVIAHTFHDDITGTSVQRAYKRSWNDYVASANEFSSVYETASKEVIKNLDTSWVKGEVIVVSNMLSFDRNGVVDVSVRVNGFKFIRIFDNEGNEVPSQVNCIKNGNIEACFFASVKAMGYRVYEAKYSNDPCVINTGLRAAENSIENFKYQVTVNHNGDIASVFDKVNNKELLAKPIRFELNKYKGAMMYAAWEMRYKDIKKYPWEFAEDGIIEVVENGICRVTMKVTQYCGKSTFTYYVSLSTGCQYVNIYNEIEWRSFRRTLHNRFCFNVKNNTSTYDLGLGCIERNIANKKLYSVPAQKWADITDKFDNFGVSIFSDSKYGWIMKDERTLRLTILHSPKRPYRHDSAQDMLDFGHNRYSYAIYSHNTKDLTETQLLANSFNQPMAVFNSGKHTGALGSSFSFINISHPSVLVRCVKKAEDSDDIIIRVNEGSNKAVNNVELSLGRGILSCSEVYASEEEKGSANVTDGKLIFSLNPYEVKSFKIKLAPCKVCKSDVQEYVDLPYNINIISDIDHTQNNIPTINAALPAELVPSNVETNGVRFKLNNNIDSLNAVACQGQNINVNGNKLYLIAASLYGDKTYEFLINGVAYPIKVQSINERIGAWDLYDLAETGYIKTDKLAYEFTHTLTNGKVNTAAQLYFFFYEIDLPSNAYITLPNDDGLLILAASTGHDVRHAGLITPLYDRLDRRPFDYKMTGKERRRHKRVLRAHKRPLNQS